MIYFYLDHSQAYGKDKRDMWTLQRMLAEESKTKHAMMSSKFSDSGRGSGSSRSSGPFKMFDRFPSLRSAARHKPYSLKMAPVNLGISGIILNPINTRSTTGR